MLHVNLVAVATLLGGAVWTFPQLFRQRFRAPLQLHLFLSLFLLGMGNLLGQLCDRRPLDDFTFVGFTKLTYNIAILSGLCLMVCFLREQPLRRRALRTRWDAVTCLCCLAAMTLLTALLPPHLRNHDFTPPFLNDWRVDAFYNIGDAYLVLGYTECAVLAARHARQGRPLRRVSLSAVSVGLIGLSLSCAFRVLWVDCRPCREFGHHITYTNAFVVGQMASTVVCVGLSLPCFASAARFLRERAVHRAQFRELGELWQRLVGYYPELVLHPGRRWLPPLDYTSAVYRRYVECRDGLIRLSPYLQRAADETGATPDALTDPDLVRLVDRALCLRGEVDLPGTAAPGPSVFVAPADSHDADYESDLISLLKLSRGLRSLRSDSRSESCAPCLS
ncbi:MAB_1171c family putative transporter [Streptomyces cacaoi]|uniref:MAB_1171c family putative transporter n=1 Tax=Streptomyces cacaoi TaxID=1898 RepID=UPI0011F26AA1|nr:MAB_1171c family putative transporter [Streptomyces cacaoi]